MSIICSICHKKQSGFLEDYPLSKEHPQMRICVACRTNLQAIEVLGDEKEAMASIEYFDKILSQGSTPEVSDRVTSAIKKRAEMEKEEEENIQTVVEPEPIKNDFRAESKDFKLDDLYADIGKKIKNWAKGLFVLEMIASVIGGIAMIISGEDELILSGVLTLILGPIVAFISTWLLYGLGELIDKTNENVKQTKKANKTADEIKNLLKETNSLLASMQNEKNK